MTVPLCKVTPDVLRAGPASQEADQAGNSRIVFELAWMS
jgi:hypothetical protein